MVAGGDGNDHYLTRLAFCFSFSFPSVGDERDLMALVARGAAVGAEGGAQC